MGQVRQYDREYKEEAIKLAEEKGCKNTSEELGIGVQKSFCQTFSKKSLCERSSQNINNQISIKPQQANTVLPYKI